MSKPTVGAPNPSRAGWRNEPPEAWDRSRPGASMPSSKQMNLTNGYSQITVTNDPEFLTTIQPQSDGSVKINADAMATGVPFPVRVGGVWLVAVKQSDGSVDFYTMPEPK